jgi:enoyl-CoA hydratase/carnithine racemase
VTPEAPVRVEKRDDLVAVVTLDRPEKLNALNADVRQRLQKALDDLERDDAVRVVVIHGAGEKAFVAGADIGEFASRTPEEQREVYAHRRVYEAVADFPKPIIVAIHGFCIGGGCELALACDVRVADRTARISQAEIRIGLMPGGGGTQRLARLVGRGWASIISLTGDFVEAEEAHRIGLVDVLVDEGRHLERALELAARMARWSPVSLRLTKDAIRAAFEMPLSEGLLYEKECFLDAFASEDGREGVRAFMEKRPPEFKGR